MICGRYVLDTNDVLSKKVDKIVNDIDKWIFVVAQSGDCTVGMKVL